MRAWLRNGIIAFCTICTSAVFAQDEPETWRWFEVEVLVFKHLDPSSAESFPWQPPTQKASQHDLLSSIYAPNFIGLIHDLPLCPEANEEVVLRPVFCAQPHEQDPFAQPWYQPQRILSGFGQAPVQVINGFGGDISTSQQPFLMPATTAEFDRFRQQLEQRGVGQTLLHTTFRTPVFGREQQHHFRLFGGKNFGADFAPTGYQQPPYKGVELAAEDNEQTPQLFDEIELLLPRVANNEVHLSYRDLGTPNPPPYQQPRDPAERPTPVWELDGNLHVYLVGNYLHIESDLELREPQVVRFNQRELAAQVEYALQNQATTTKFLRSYSLNQVRRVISHETHYFDHPRLGLAVQIRRTELSARR